MVFPFTRFLIRSKAFLRLLLKIKKVLLKDPIENLFNRSLETSEKVNTHINLISKETDLIGRFYEAKI